MESILVTALGSLLRSTWGRVAVDTSALRDSPDLRALIAGNLVTGLGTQAALVALPYQLYTQTGSAFLGRCCSTRSRS